MRRSFTTRTGTYSDTPAGWLKAAKDDWADKMRNAGHRMTWRKSYSQYIGNCSRCGGNVVVGDTYTTSHGHDIRRRKCSR